jgi:predicted phosphodiesterase
MRYAVISDIHSNLESLTACFNKIDTLDVDRIICLGDIVGYNANPNECIDLIREKGVMCVMGNHDSRAAGLEEPTDFNLLAANAIYWTRNAITEENRAFLKDLPRTLFVDNKFLAIHGWVNDTDQYILGAKDALTNFGLLKEFAKTNLCFFGHTHVAISYLEVKGSVVLNLDSSLKLAKGINYLVNPGGLGQPRDRDPRAPFLIYDSKKSEITFYRVQYDILSTAEKIIAAGLPERVAERLKLGW